MQNILLVCVNADKQENFIKCDEIITAVTGNNLSDYNLFVINPDNVNHTFLIPKINYFKAKFGHCDISIFRNIKFDFILMTGCMSYLKGGKLGDNSPFKEGTDKLIFNLLKNNGKFIYESKDELHMYDFDGQDYSGNINAMLGEPQEYKYKSNRVAFVWEKIKNKKIKISTLKYCIKQFLKKDTTVMTVNDMIQLITTKLTEKVVKPKTGANLGKVYICTMKRGIKRPVPDTDESFLTLNVTSSQATNSKERRDFSPMTEIPGGSHGFWNFEHFWQSGKVFRGFSDKYVKSVWKSLKEPTRYFPLTEIKKYCKKNQMLCPSDATEIRAFMNKSILYSKWDDVHPTEHMDWVTSRKKVYAPLYFEYMKDKPSALKWKKYREDGNNIVVYDFDGPKDTDENGICIEVTLETLRKQINCKRFSFGHGYIVAAWLLGIRPEEYI